MQQIQLNIIPFKSVVNNQTFAFYGEKQKGFAPIYWDICCRLLMGLFDFINEPLFD